MPVLISHFSDVLCVWAYIAQVRIDELVAEFGDQITLDYSFCSVFGDTHMKIGEGWRERGGFAGYAAHVRSLGERFDHIAIHPDIWTRNVPASSVAAHAFLHALALTLETQTTEKGTTSFAAAIWRVRTAFFRDLVDIASRPQQLDIAAELGFDVDSVRSFMDSGRAAARVSRDVDRAATLHVTVSPTLVFNEGRQRLNGNVGFRIIEANVRELLRASDVGHSWC